MKAPNSVDTGHSPELAWGRLFWIAIATLSTLVIAVWFMIPWQWSPVDDPGQVLAMKNLVASHGDVGAVLTRTAELAVTDRQGGVFRPLAWIYPPLIYSLPPQAAHIVRLLMLLLCLVGPLVYFRREGASKPRLLVTALVLVIAAGTLYQGLLLISVQELGGVFFISMGLLLAGQRVRLVLFTLAALFKAPFLWVLFGYAILLWRRGYRRLALVSGGAGLAILIVNIWWQRGGSYAGGYSINVFDPELWNSASNILEPVNGAILLAVLWWIAISRTSLVYRADLPLFATAAVGYYLQMVPWGFTAYYMGPISFLLGLTLASMLADPPPLTWLRLGVGLVLPALLAVWILKSSIGFVLGSNAIMAQAAECLAAEEPTKTEVVGDWLYVTTSPEGPLRLQQNTALVFDEWPGTVGLDTALGGSGRDLSVTHILAINGEPIPEAGPIVCERPMVKLMRIK